MKLNEEIQELINTMVTSHEKAEYYREPVIGYASAEDELYNQLDDIIGNPQIHPTQMLKGAKTVIVVFLPYSKLIYDDMNNGKLTSSMYSDAYMVTNDLLDQIAESAADLLRKKGYQAVTEPPTENFDHVTKTAKWGHKSNAVIAGIGTIGLNHLLITGKGCMGRANSFVTDAKLPVTPRTEHEYCLYYQSGKCKACVKRCPSGAICSDGTIDKFRCDSYLEGKNISDWQQGCPQCQLGPCAMKGF
ncbi:MAG: epoxyqueuosine reductase [Lachnospiraceae bacterium]|jgi:epoxyqueuosine reductase|nr:epoxyqueuosine reductase [Lachnospiraceae bacterium]MDD3614817.1 epoxyqueuosine reductase [Lachnospiraceae bacterium]